MSKAVMLSIRPKWVEKIVNGEKTIEVRKTRPKLQTPFKCYIYCTMDHPYISYPAGNWTSSTIAQIPLVGVMARSLASSPVTAFMSWKQNHTAAVTMSKERVSRQQTRWRVSRVLLSKICTNI